MQELTTKGSAQTVNQISTLITAPKKVEAMSPSATLRLTEEGQKGTFLRRVSYGALTQTTYK
jgi:hypothetical protein